jgi:hypothetical protein
MFRGLVVYPADENRMAPANDSRREVAVIV